MFLSDQLAQEQREDPNVVGVEPGILVDDVFVEIVQLEGIGLIGENGAFIEFRGFFDVYYISMLSHEFFKTRANVDRQNHVVLYILIKENVKLDIPAIQEDGFVAELFLHIVKRSDYALETIGDSIDCILSHKVLNRGFNKACERVAAI
jgi:hypothetical protein